MLLKQKLLLVLHTYAFTMTAAGAGLHMPVAVSQLLADPVASFAANPEWTRYAFMFPVGIFVATCAQTAGIGGAAIMGPFFVLGFPLLGPAYPLHSVAASVATAILSEAFGFSSGEQSHPFYSARLVLRGVSPAWVYFAAGSFLRSPSSTLHPAAHTRLSTCGIHGQFFEA